MKRNRHLNLIGSVCLSALMTSCAAWSQSTPSADDPAVVQTEPDPVTPLVQTGPDRSEPQQDLDGLFADREDVPREVTRRQGSGEFINQEPNRVATGQSGDYDIILESVSIEDAADAILGQILEQSYVIDRQINSQITLKSNKSLNKAGVLALFESALDAVGAELSFDGTLYKIVPRGSNGTDAPKRLTQSDQAGGLSIIALEFIAAAEMARILEPVAGAGSIVRVDQARNLLMLDGSAAELTALTDLVSVFDKDWMSGMSVSILPVEADPEILIQDLEALFGNAEGGPAEGLIRFLPNARLSSVLAISARSDLLRQAETWIETLEGEQGQQAIGIDIYEVQNRIASDLAVVLQSVGAPGADNFQPEALPPGADPVTLTRSGVSGAPPFQAGTANGITVDEDNNALIIVGDKPRRQALLKLAERLDVTPHQVLIEVTIAEVALVDELEFGVQWFFEEGDGQIALSDVASGAVASQFPGFSFVLEGTDGSVVLNALSAVTDVKVVSSPAVMVLNNQTATLQVGDQVPITTQTAQSVTDDNTPIINSVTLRDTGILMTVTPRVNEEGRVLLEIVQEVSDVVPTTSSGIDSPTIQQRRVETTVIVGDQKTLLLGGLIQDDITEVVTGVPVLRSIPLLGALFRSTSDDTDRTELLILIKPKVVRNEDEANRITEEYKRRVKEADALLFKVK